MERTWWEPADDEDPADTDYRGTVLDPDSPVIASDQPPADPAQPATDPSGG